MSSPMPSRSPSPSRWWQHWVMKPKNWWLPLLVVTLTGFASLGFVGTKTYTDAPPMVDFVAADGRVVIAQSSIVQGQVFFLQRGLMDYGSLFGDGAGRGPDFTAQALHQQFQFMTDFFRRQQPPLSDTQAQSLARASLKQNGLHDDRIMLDAAQVFAAQQLREFYVDFFQQQHALLPALQNANTQDLHALSDFFFWSAWVASAPRPGKTYSYTNNWPFDPAVGNTPPAATVLWSMLALVGLMLALGGVLFLHGRFAQLVGWRSPAIATTTPHHHAASAMQRASYKFFATAALLFLLQVFAGVLTVHNFLGLTNFFGVDVSQWVSLVSARGWHLQLALLWITSCWIGLSFFLLSASFPAQPRYQIALINTLYGLLLTMVIGNLVGVLLGPSGVFGEWWNWLGHQGWEFVEMGKLWQVFLMIALVVWAIILGRSILPHWKKQQMWWLPNWLFYCVVAVSLLFISSFIAKPETNFVIADFWRWAVVHMWVEAFFEVFATIVVAYVMYLMGFVSQHGASRIVYIATLLFLGSGLFGLSHNFYWNAKPVATLAIGSIFSTLQVVPLILLALEAWQFRRLAPSNASHFSQHEAFLFLLGVNFWNFLGAGVFGFLLNLPIINYYEHGTYLTVNHGHAAFMGVYGNLSLAAMFFCARYLLPEARWNATLIRRIFWSINIGLFLMVMLDLFPVGIHQLWQVTERGLWFARDEAYIQSDTFQWLTWSRIVGGLLFTCGGVIPLTWFMLSRWQPPQTNVEIEMNGEKVGA